MPRLYHSPSSISLGMRCPRAYALRYIGKLREPEPVWKEGIQERPADSLYVKPEWVDRSKLTIDLRRRLGGKQRSLALGKALHSVSEGHYQGADVDWTTFPAQVFLSGAHYLPHPDLCHAVRVEEEIGGVDLPPDPNPTHKDHPTRAMAYGGLLWVLRRDLLVSAPAEFLRLGIDAPDGWLQADYKTTGQLEDTAERPSFVPTPAKLETDIQQNFYTLGTCTQLGLDELPSRWVYFETKKRRRAKCVDVLGTVSRAHDILGPVVERAHALDKITSVEDAEQNPLACGDYGGCIYHVTAGGPCNARRSIGRLIQIRAKREVAPMANGLDPKVQARFDALKNKSKAAPAEVEETEPETENEEAETEAETEEETPPPPPPKKPAKPAPKAAPAAPKAPAKPVSKPAPAKPTPAPSVKVTEDARSLKVTFTFEGAPEEVALVHEAVQGLFEG